MRVGELFRGRCSPGRELLAIRGRSECLTHPILASPGPISWCRFLITYSVFEISLDDFLFYFLKSHSCQFSFSHTNLELSPKKSMVTFLNHRMKYKSSTWDRVLHQAIMYSLLHCCHYPKSLVLLKGLGNICMFFPSPWVFLFIPECSGQMYLF